MVAHAKTLAFASQALSASRAARLLLGAPDTPRGQLCRLILLLWLLYHAAWTPAKMMAPHAAAQLALALAAARCARCILALCFAAFPARACSARERSCLRAAVAATPEAALCAAFVHKAEAADAAAAAARAEARIYAQVVAEVAALRATPWRTLVRGALLGSGRISSSAVSLLSAFVAALLLLRLLLGWPSIDHYCLPMLPWLPPAPALAMAARLAASARATLQPPSPELMGICIDKLIGRHKRIAAAASGNSASSVPDHDERLSLVRTCDILVAGGATPPFDARSACLPAAEWVIYVALAWLHARAWAFAAASLANLVCTAREAAAAEDAADVAASNPSFKERDAAWAPTVQAALFSSRAALPPLGQSSAAARGGVRRAVAWAATVFRLVLGAFAGFILHLSMVMVWAEDLLAQNAAVVCFDSSTLRSRLIISFGLLLAYAVGVRCCAMLALAVARFAAPHAAARLLFVSLPRITWQAVQGWGLATVLLQWTRLYLAQSFEDDGEPITVYGLTGVWEAAGLQALTAVVAAHVAYTVAAAARAAWRGGVGSADPVLPLTARNKDWAVATAFALFNPLFWLWALTGITFTDASHGCSASGSTQLTLTALGLVCLGAPPLLRVPFLLPSTLPADVLQREGFRSIAALWLELRAACIACMLVAASARGVLWGCDVDAPWMQLSLAEEDARLGDAMSRSRRAAQRALAPAMVWALGGCRHSVNAAARIVLAPVARLLRYMVRVAHRPPPAVEQVVRRRRATVASRSSEEAAPQQQLPLAAPAAAPPPPPVTPSPPSGATRASRKKASTRKPGAPAAAAAAAAASSATTAAAPVPPAPLLQQPLLHEMVPPAASAAAGVASPVLPIAPSHSAAAAAAAVVQPSPPMLPHTDTAPPPAAAEPPAPAPAAANAAAPPPAHKMAEMLPPPAQQQAPLLPPAPADGLQQEQAPPGAVVQPDLHAHAAPLPPAPPPPPAERECCICLDSVPADELCVLAPCGHRCVCGDCAGALLAEAAARRKCPKCRADVAAVVPRVWEE